MGVCVLDYGHKVLVQVLGHFQVVADVVVVLVQGTANLDVHEQIEDELFGVLVRMESIPCLVILGLLP